MTSATRSERGARSSARGGKTRRVPTANGTPGLDTIPQALRGDDARIVLRRLADRDPQQHVRHECQLEGPRARTPRRSGTSPVSAARRHTPKLRHFDRFFLASHFCRTVAHDRHDASSALQLGCLSCPCTTCGGPWPDAAACVADRLQVRGQWQSRLLGLAVSRCPAGRCDADARTRSIDRASADRQRCTRREAQRTDGRSPSSASQ